MHGLPQIYNFRVALRDILAIAIEGHLQIFSDN